MAYFVNSYRAHTQPRARGLWRFVRMPLGVGISIKDGVVSESWVMSPEAVAAADLYIQGGITQEIDEETYDLILAYEPGWVWEE